MRDHRTAEYERLEAVADELLEQWKQWDIAHDPDNEAHRLRLIELRSEARGAMIAAAAFNRGRRR